MRRDWLPITTTPWSLGLLLVTTLLLIQATELPSRINDWMYDRAITTWPAPMDDSVAIIAIDEFSLDFRDPKQVWWLCTCINWAMNNYIDESGYNAPY